MDKSTIKIKERNSSVEIYRIIATFLVLIVHFNGWLADMPEKFTTFSVFTVSQTFIEAFSCICVNCFLVITGWYGLKLKFKHLWTIYSVIVFIYVPFYLATCFYHHTFSINQFLMNFIAIGRESYYIQCYLMLVFLSPVLNSFIKHFGRNILIWTLTFWIIEVCLDWILSNKCLGFAKGYGLTHFILLYFIGQTASIYKKEINKYLKDIYCIFIIIVGILLIGLLYICGLSMKDAFAYSNPINIIMAFMLFFIFERKTYHSKIINWIGSSTLAVYILHITPPVLTIIKKWDLYSLSHYSYSKYLILITLTIIGIFLIGILYDKIRILFFKPFNLIIYRSKFYKKINFFNA